MHESSFLRMQWIEKEFLAPKRSDKIRILDVGSMDINGSYRSIFVDKKYSYTGLDMAAGPNVDIVLSKPYDWSMIADAGFDAVVSGQVFEHVEFFWKTFEEMVRVLKAGGLMAIIVPRLQNRHRYPVDTFRFDVDGLIALAKFGNLVPLHVSMNMKPESESDKWFDPSVGDAMLVARKPENWSGMADTKSYVFTDVDIGTLSSGFVENNTGPLLLPFETCGENPGFTALKMRFEHSLRELRVCGEGAVILGAGAIGVRLYELLWAENINVVAFCDNSPQKQGTMIGDIPILPLSVAVEKYPDSKVIIATAKDKYMNEFLVQLHDAGVARCYVACARMVLGLPDE